MKQTTIGYTYYITFLPTGQIYYGSKCSKGSHPDNFWKTYFTSSKLVKDLIKQFGLNAFTFKIRKIFKDDPKLAQSWERRVLKKIKAGERLDFLNKSNGVAPILVSWKNPFYGKTHSEETKKKMSEAAIRRTRNTSECNMYGKKHSKETRDIMSSQRKGKNYIEKYGEEKAIEIKEKLSKKLSGKNNPMYGKERLDMLGDKNPAKQEEVRKKLSEAAKLREVRKRKID